MAMSSGKQPIDPAVIICEVGRVLVIEIQFTSATQHNMATKYLHKLGLFENIVVFIGYVPTTKSLLNQLLRLTFV